MSRLRFKLIKTPLFTYRSSCGSTEHHLKFALAHRVRRGQSRVDVQSQQLHRAVDMRRLKFIAWTLAAFLLAFASASDDVAVAKICGDGDIDCNSCDCVIGACNKDGTCRCEDGEK
jgi:hypothetical protein